MRFRWGYVTVDRDDRARSYLEARIALPRSIQQRLRLRRWRAFARTLPPGTSMVQVFDAKSFVLTRSSRER